MTLFFNTGEHPGVFKSNQLIEENNQSFYRRDHVAELIKEQEQIYQTLVQSLRELALFQKQQAKQQEQKWLESDQYRETFKEEQLDRKDFEKDATRLLHQLSKQLAEFDGRVGEQEQTNQAMVQQIASWQASNQHMTDYLNQHTAYNEQLSEKLDEWSHRQVERDEALQTYVQEHRDMNERLENQEALSEKIMRQLDQLRANLFERSSHLAEKIDDGYQLTSSYIYQLLTGSHPSVTFLLSEEKNEDKKR